MVTLVMRTDKPRAASFLFSALPADSVIYFELDLLSLTWPFEFFPTKFPLLVLFQFCPLTYLSSSISFISLFSCPLTIFFLKDIVSFISANIISLYIFWFTNIRVYFLYECTFPKTLWFMGNLIIFREVDLIARFSLD